MTALLYQNFYLRDLISLMEMDVKNLFGDFWKSPEIPDYTDYQTITRIRNLKKLKKNLCNHFLKSVQSGEREMVFHSSPFQVAR
jgi:hypothetical protein